MEGTEAKEEEAAENTRQEDVRKARRERKQREKAEKASQKETGGSTQSRTEESSVVSGSIHQPQGVTKEVCCSLPILSFRKSRSVLIALV